MNLLVTGAFNCSEKQLEILEQLGNKVFFMKNEKDDLPCSYESIEGVICNGLFLYHPIEKFSQLKYIQLTSAGMDRLDVEYAKANGIKVNNARGVYSIPMAEFAVCGVLQLYKKCRFFYENQKTHIWQKNRTLLELNGKTVCIVGCGSVGEECAKRFAAFGNKIIGVDLLVTENSVFNKMVPITQIEKVLPESDIIILSLPLTEKTRGMFDEKMFAKMKVGSVFVNISRGGVVETQSLINAVKNKLFGAVLDVFEQEPLDSSQELWDLENVILTPHNSFVGEGNEQRLFEVVVNNLKKF